MRPLFTMPILTALSALLAFGTVPAHGAGSLFPTRVRCEYRVDPQGIDSPNARLDWLLQPVDPAAHDLAQSAYEVVVASTPDLLAGDRGDLWDSGKVLSNQTAQVSYAGRPLASHAAVWWKVRVWDQAGAPSAWSPIGRWTMGVLNPADWSGARWIGAPDANQPADLKAAKPTYETVLLRREFTVKPGLRRALVHVCGLGQYELTLNGRKVGTDLLTPGWTQYDKTCLYDTYDVTAALRAGPNAAGLFLGNGFFNVHGGRYTKLTLSFGQLQACALLRLEYQDGSVTTLVTDDHWKTASGPITFSSIYGGEDFDARLVQDGWDQPGFDEAKWETPAVTAGPGGVLEGPLGGRTADQDLRDVDAAAGRPGGGRQAPAVPARRQGLRPGAERLVHARAGWNQGTGRSLDQGHPVRVGQAKRRHRRHDVPGRFVLDLHPARPGGRE